MAKKEEKVLEKRVVRLTKIGETLTQFTLKDEESGVQIRVPKETKNIPPKSIMIGTSDVTEDVKKFVEGLKKK